MKKSKGFTLIELLIVITLISILSLIAFMAWQNQAAKARDARRKADLKRLSIAFEDYYGDNDKYPQFNIITNCGSKDLAPYLAEAIPCDPKTRLPYCYIYDSQDPEPEAQDFRLLANLENPDDPDIGKLGCAGTDYCGYQDECNTLDSRYAYGFNYGSSSTNVAVLNPNTPFNSGSSPTPSALPSGIPSPHPYVAGQYIYACNGNESGQCNSYDHNVSNCNFFANSNCDTMCLNPAYWCYE